MRGRQSPTKRATKKSTLQEDGFEEVIYSGKRPLHDEPNETRKKIASFFQSSATLHELYPEKFYLAYIKDVSATDFVNDQKCRTGLKFALYPFEYTEVIHYVPFNCDFGPLHLGAVHMLISRLKVLFDTLALRDEDCVVVVLDDLDFKMRLNATFAVAAAALTLFDMTDVDVLRNLQFSFKHPTCNDICKPVYIESARKFSDVSGLRSEVKLGLKDCIKGFYLALERGFYNYYTFDHMEYLYYEMVHTGDINWIVPGKLLAFAGPSDKKTTAAEKHSPKFYFDYFKERHVTDIVRLNSPDYDETTFTEAGFKHHDLIFPDGFPPTSTIARKFIKLTDEAEGAVAVHCFAGIGRTGTLIAAYLVAKYGFTAESAIAWTRICRPGSVIGDQQDWLLNYFEKDGAFYLKKSNNCLDKAQTQEETAAISATSNSTATGSQPGEEDDELLRNDPEFNQAEMEFGQAHALVQTKQKRETAAAKRNTTTKPEPTDVTNTKIVTRSAQKRKKEMNTALDKNELILDLGKTMPFNFVVSSMTGYDQIGKYPPHYVLNDGQHFWKVKFPQPDYIKLQLNFKTNDVKDKEEIVDEPTFDCFSRYNSSTTDDSEIKRPLVRLSGGLPNSHPLDIPLQKFIWQEDDILDEADLDSD